MAISANRSWPAWSNALTPTIRQIPAMPDITPNSLRGGEASCRVTSAVNRKVKIGAAELRMVASPASVEAGLKCEATPGRHIRRHGDAAPAHDEEQQHTRNEGEKRDQRDRRNGGDAELDEAVGGSPECGQQQEQRELARDAGARRMASVRHFRSRFQSRPNLPTGSAKTFR
jgi:hypothetical protein